MYVQYFYTNSLWNSLLFSAQFTNNTAAFERDFSTSFLPQLNFKLALYIRTNKSTYSPGVFEVSGHLSSTRLPKIWPKHDSLLKVTLGVHLHLSHLPIARRPRNRRLRPNIAAQAQAGGDGQLCSGGAAVEPRLARWQHGVWDVVLV